MSLYTIAASAKLPSVKTPEGLRIEECADITLLSLLGTTTREDIISRLANDHLAFVAYINNQPAAFGWMARGKATIGELNHTFILPEANRYLWNFRTLPAFRGLGIYPALLHYILRYEGDKVKQFWIIHAPENGSSLKGIVKAGFEYVGKLYTKAGSGVCIEANDKAKMYHKLLTYMDIHLSDDSAASCWNCSSPYLKKRIPECCCTTSGIECNGSLILALAS